METKKLNLILNYETKCFKFAFVKLMNPKQVLEIPKKQILNFDRIYFYIILS